jgi:hypothetical protein
MCLEKSLIYLARVLATSLEMMQEASSRLALRERHAQRLLNQGVGFHPGTTLTRAQLLPFWGINLT